MPKIYTISISLDQGFIKLTVNSKTGRNCKKEIINFTWGAIRGRKFVIWEIFQKFMQLFWFDYEMV